MRAPLSAFLTSALVVTCAIPSLAAVPSPVNSTVPPVLATTPGGNIATSIVVRDLANNPISGSTVVIDYNNCAGFVPCSAASSPIPDGYILDEGAKQIRMVTAFNGQAPFYLRAGGGCSSTGIRVFADGVLLASIHAASADQSGDLTVDASDVALVHAKIGTSDLSGDLDGNGIVDASDEGAVSGYVGTACDNPTDTRRTTWGRVKTIYR
jgi:hypothetical protein